jgi:hypothetical protein
MTNGLLAATVVLGIAFAVLIALASRRALRPYVRRALVTESELRFYHRLSAALPQDHSVFPQVSMGALLEPIASAARGRPHDFRRSSCKRCDFVVVNGKLQVQVVIELDDHTHDAPNDWARDAQLASAGSRTPRMDVRRPPTQEQLVILLSQSLRQGRAVC